MHVHMKDCYAFMENGPLCLYVMPSSSVSFPWSEICIVWNSYTYTSFPSLVLAWDIFLHSFTFHLSLYIFEVGCLGFPGGAVVKNPPANAGDTGLSPGPGRSHMPQSNKTHAPQQLSLHSRTQKPQLLSPCATTTEACAPRAHALLQEKPLQWEACAPQWRAAPARRN